MADETQGLVDAGRDTCRPPRGVTEHADGEVALVPGQRPGVSANEGRVAPVEDDAVTADDPVVADVRPTPRALVERLDHLHPVTAVLVALWLVADLARVMHG